MTNVGPRNLKASGPMFMDAFGSVAGRLTAASSFGSIVSRISSRQTKSKAEASSLPQYPAVLARSAVSSAAGGAAGGRVCAGSGGTRKQTIRNASAERATWRDELMVLPPPEAGQRDRRLG